MLTKRSAASCNENEIITSMKNFIARRITTSVSGPGYLKGYRMVSFNLKVLAKFCLCSNCSQKLDECSLARARKIFATADARILVKITLPCSVNHNLHLGHWTQCFRYRKLEIIREICTSYNISGKMLHRFTDVY